MNGRFVRLSSFVVLAVFACSRPPSGTRDDLGRAVSLPSSVERVVTLAPNLTEMVFAAGTGAKLVGTDEFSDFPPAARALPKVGGMQPNVEKIVALRPDLVIATTNGNHPNLATALAAAGVPLYVVRSERLDDVPRAMAAVARLTGGRDTTASFLATLERERRQRPDAKRVMFAVWADPLYVAGRSTHIDDLFELTGARNAVPASGWPQLSIETLIAEAPDVILHPHRSVKPESVRALLPRGTRCEIVAVDEDLFTRPGPRAAAAAAQLNAVLDRMR